MTEGVHERGTNLLHNLRGDEYQRVFIHPEHEKIFRLDENIGLYA
jgi:hypothetical protein